MPSPKRTIPASELQPGESFRFALEDTHTFYPHSVYTPASGLVEIETTNHKGNLESYRLGGDRAVVVGYTNRKAKRQRGKAVRRERLRAARDAGGPNVLRRGDVGASA